MVFRSISFVLTAPIVSIPRLRGVTSNNNTSLTSPCNTPPCIAAPIATTSSGLTPFIGSFPKIFLTCSWTAGIRVIPPTNTTASISLALTPASLSAFSQGIAVFSIRSPTRLSSFARVNLCSKCFGPSASAVKNGKFTLTSFAEDNSILAFSASSLRRCIAALSPVISIPCSFLNSSAK